MNHKKLIQREFEVLAYNILGCLFSIVLIVKKSLTLKAYLTQERNH